MKAIIIDKNEKDQDSLAAYIMQGFPYVSILAKVSTIKSGVEAIREFSPDLIFIDIIFSDGNAFDLLNQFKHLRFKIIFVSSDSHYAIKALRYRVFDYLIKPVDVQDLEIVMERLNTLSYEDEAPLERKLHIEKKHAVNTGATKKIVLATDNSIYIVNINDIMYCDADNGYTIFYLNNNTKIMVTRTLKEYETLLESYSFLRTHKSHLVNFKYITRFSNEDGGMIILQNNHAVPVSFRKKELIIKAINESALN